MIKLINYRGFSKQVQRGPLKSFLSYTESNPFPLENIPFGAFNTQNTQHCCTRIGDYVIDLSVLEQNGLFDGPLFKSLNRKDIFAQSTLNTFMGLDKAYHREARQTLQSLFAHDSKKLSTEVRQKALIPFDKANLVMPVFIRDYTDFYSSKNHAWNCGVMINGPEKPLAPNWLHLPTAYHSRASTVVVSGTDIIRPKGQVTSDKINPRWSHSRRLDFELEVGAFIGKSNQLGHPIKLSDAPEHIFGFTLLNDWSARDIQLWELFPLGPFNSKNFATTISPWVVTTDALEPFKVKLDPQDPQPLDYLRDPNNYSYNVELDVLLQTKKMTTPTSISKSNFKYMYWSTNQQVTHHTVTGCSLSVGDILGSGTVSGPQKGSYGCLLEMTWGGKDPIKLENGEERKFLEDGDVLTFKGTCKGEGYTIGFGECSGTILPALDDKHYF